MKKEEISEVYVRFLLFTVLLFFSNIMKTLEEICQVYLLKNSFIYFFVIFSNIMKTLGSL